LSGEQKVCPRCGRVTEVYSRITGYYRPVQNWNEGKIQEYKNRTEYDTIEYKGKRHELRGNIDGKNGGSNDKNIGENVEGSVLLFTTKTCPNCRLAKEYLGGIDYTVIDAEENSQLAASYGIMQAPTLVVVSGQSRQKYVNVSNIKKYAEQYKGA
jgi:ribonucleoside-triphosphate reductase